jgi:hypothetical protein
VFNKDAIASYANVLLRGALFPSFTRDPVTLQTGIQLTRIRIKINYARRVAYTACNQPDMMNVVKFIPLYIEREREREREAVGHCELGSVMMKDSAFPSETSCIQIRDT